MSLDKVINYKFNRNVYFRKLPDKFVIYDIRDKQFRYLNNIAELIFQKIQPNDTIETIASTLGSIFNEVSISNLKQDVLDFAEHFSKSVDGIGEGFSNIWNQTNKRKRPTEFGCPGLGYLENRNFKESYKYSLDILESCNE